MQRARPTGQADYDRRAGATTPPGSPRAEPRSSRSTEVAVRQALNYATPRMRSIQSCSTESVLNEHHVRKDDLLGFVGSGISLDRLRNKTAHITIIRAEWTPSVIMTPGDPRDFGRSRRSHHKVRGPGSTSRSTSRYWTKARPSAPNGQEGRLRCPHCGHLPFTSDVAD